MASLALSEPTSSTASAKGVVKLARASDGAIVCERCVIAHTMFGRMRGLLGRRELPAGEAMLIRPAPSIQTFFMRFPIDVVFLNRDGEVLKVCEDVGPWRAAAARRAHSTLELAAGEAKRRGIAVGHRLVVHAPTQQE